MKLRFYACRDLLVTEPNYHPSIGQPPRYVGRRAEKRDGRHAFPAIDKPYQVEANSTAGRRLAKRIYRGAYNGAPELWCADEATAKACGVSYIPVVFKDGEWTPGSSKDDKGDASNKGGAHDDPPTSADTNEPATGGSAARANKRPRTKRE